MYICDISMKFVVVKPQYSGFTKTVCPVNKLVFQSTVHCPVNGLKLVSSAENTPTDCYFAKIKKQRRLNEIGLQYLKIFGNEYKLHDPIM